MSEELRLPSAPSERRAWLLALALLAFGVAVLVAALTGALGSSVRRVSAAAPPRVLAAAQTPAPVGGAARARIAGRGAPGAGPYAGGAGVRRYAAGGQGGTGTGGTRLLAAVTAVHIPAAWEAGFYPIYAEAQRAFGVNWLLLASIHMQESAFSTAPTTYHGLNFAGCCGGPMQFNVTNGPITTWQLVRGAYRYGTRPASYDHRTARHPSIYDDFDSVMAAAWLLSSDGARATLDDSAWWAAYDYYGHDATGVSYADEVLARSIGWSQDGFCINCGVSQSLVEAVHAAYGAPVLETLDVAPVAQTARARHAKRRRR
ncbi:MAG TPA: hypothetical protein VGI76_10730 [Solirubrobacteraceae bacterium]